ncbi:MAG TPA: hypothetical protein VFQ79_00265 [Bryobacteraceae bacterium]|nr:hypothetical protein [Bryobacteraceae bacterium]
MFHVGRTEEQSGTVITIDGKLSHDCIEFVETYCSQEISTGKPVALFLRDLTIIDEAGRALLRRLTAKGVRLLASGVYTSYIVQGLIPTKDADG